MEQIPPTVADDMDPMPDLPKWPKVIGILSIVWGCIGIGCVGCGAAMMPWYAQMLESQLQGAPLPPTMKFGPLDYGLMGFSVVLTLLLLAAGIATVQRKAVGRSLHLAYAALSLPLVAVNIWNTIEKNAAMDQWARDYPNNPIAQNHTTMGGGSVIIGIAMVLVFGLAWPAFCLVWFGLVKNTADLTKGTDYQPAA